MRNPLRTAAVATALCLLMPLVAAGCTRSADLPRCPDGGRFTAAAVWTTVYSKTSYIQFYDGTRLAAQTPIQVQGVMTPGQGVLHVGDARVLIANGNQDHDKTSIVAIRPQTCAVFQSQVNQPGILDATTDGSNVLLTNAVISGFDGVNGALLRVYDLAGTTLAEHNYGPGHMSALAQDGTHVYAFLQNMDPVTGPGPITLMDNQMPDLSRPVAMSSSALPTGAPVPVSATVLNGQLFFPMTISNAGTEDNRLGVVDLATGIVTAVELPSPSPFTVTSRGDLVYVAHSMMNPSFHPMSSYRSVSVYDPATGTVQGYTLKEGINSIAVSDTTLAAIGEDDGGTMHLHTYSLPDMKPQDDVTLTAPVGMNGGYVADVFLPN